MWNNCRMGIENLSLDSVVTIKLDYDVNEENVQQIRRFIKSARDLSKQELELVYFFKEKLAEFEKGLLSPNE